MLYRKIKIRLTLLMLIQFFYFNVYSQESADTLQREMDINAFPYLFYTPETELAFGVGGIATFYTGSEKILRPSSITLSGYYSTNSQYLITLNPEFYFILNKFFLSLTLDYGFFVDKYYGKGNQTPEIENPDYTLNEFSIELNFQLPSIFNLSYKSGILYEYRNVNIVDTKTNPFLNNEETLGTDGGISSGLGLIWVWDTRDNIFFPNKGGYHQVKAQYYMEAIGSDYDFNMYTVDIRRYFPIAADHIYGFQVYGSFVAGNPPFYELSALGGQYLMRGYFEGRYRDNNFITAQAEYRTFIWWKIGIVGFFGIGDVSENFRDFKLTNAKFSYGFGLRYKFNVLEKVNIRADFGFGEGTSGIYFGIEEAF